MSDLDEVNVARWRRPDGSRFAVSIPRSEDADELVAITITRSAEPVRIVFALEELPQLLDVVVRASRALERRRIERGSDT